MSDFEPFYDVSRSYEDNYEQGPFGAFAEALKDGSGADAAGTTSEGASEGALATFLGQPVNLPFGIPAGPLLNSTINTISAKLVDANGNQALPGAGRDRSGVCGNAIRGAGLDMVVRLAAIREKLGLDFAINGVGGVVSPADYQAYRDAGADSVMSATGAMWDAELAHKIKASR